MEIWIPVIVAVISSVGSFLGVYFSNRKASKENGELIDYRIGQLEKKMDQYNHVRERVESLEKSQVIHEEKIKVHENRILDLEKKGA